MFNKLSDVIKYYQDYHLTKHNYQYVADNLSYFDKYNLADIRKVHIKQYYAHRRQQVSNATINREISYARASINRVNIDYELNLNNPFCNIKFVEEDVIPNYLTVKDYQKLLESALQTDNHDLHDFIVLLVMTGCRPIELLTLEWCNVYLDKRQFVVRNYYSKTKRTMYKYLNDTAINLLLERQNHKIGRFVFTNPQTMDRYKSFGKGFALCKKRAGINCTLYDLRHTYASWLVQKGISIYLVKDLLGHSDIASTMRYAHLDYESYLNALSKIG